MEHRNGVIRYYSVELIEDNETSSQEYSTESPYSLIGGLQPNVTYMIRVAAFTVEKGPLSERSVIVLDDINIGKDTKVDLHALSLFTLRWVVAGDEANTCVYGR